MGAPVRPSVAWGDGTGFQLQTQTRKNMKLYTIEQTVKYVAEIEAETEEEAFRAYLDDQDAYYWGVEEERITYEEISDDDDL